jgi:N6-L-threonylcarbamoyladenine synthase
LLALIVSGGHSLLVKVEADGTCETLGRTLDDAAGEAFDKAARILQLSYPGGPLIDRLAAHGNPRAVDFPRGLTGGSGTPLKPENRYNFSFSGLKTSLLYHVRRDPTGGSDLRELGEQEFVDIIASYQEAIVDVLVLKTCWAAQESRAPTVVLCGGVACNSRLRGRLTAELGRRNVRLLIAPPKYCTDNAAMITGLAWYQHRAGLASTLELDAFPRHPGFTRLPFAPRAPRVR